MTATLTPRFEDALDVRALPDGRNWLVLAAFHYDTDVLLDGRDSVLGPVYTIDGGSRIEVPAGFVTDFASIPKVLWGVVGGPAEGKYRLAAVVHDLLYRRIGLATRPQADGVLLEAMKVAGCSWWQRMVIYSGVRVGGGSSYKGGL